MMVYGAHFSLLDISLMIAAVLITVVAQTKIKGAYRKYSKIGVRSGTTGAEIARRMMSNEGIGDVTLECIPGEMTDHYDPTSKTVRLSDAVYQGNSIASLGIAAHEVGHVIQHAHAYAPLALRHFIYPISSIGSKLAWPIIIAGLFFGIGPTWLVNLGVWLFAASVAFTIVTLPVEFNASSRALRALSQGGVMTDEELGGTRSVLNAAALTYVAAAAAAVLTLIRLLLLARGRN